MLSPQALFGRCLRLILRLNQKLTHFERTQLILQQIKTPNCSKKKSWLNILNQVLIAELAKL
jgi:hypothetical protein